LMIAQPGTNPPSLPLPLSLEKAPERTP
jgi:hypothetical protein